MDFPTGGCLYVWGKNADGCLGLPRQCIDGDGECPLPTPVPKLQDVVQTSCGDCGTAAVTAHGALYSWGRGARLGLGDEGEHPMPERVLGALGDLFVVQVSLGENHAACITRDQRAWSWGKGNHGCLGDGDATLRHSRTQPGPILTQDGGQLGGVCFITCGFEYSACVLVDGALCTWGRGDQGQLGHGSTAAVLHPTAITGLPATTCASCGSLYMGCVTAEGLVYLWGYGLAGNLGQGNRKSSSIPLQVKGLDQPAVGVSCTVGQIVAKGGKVDGEENPHTLIVAADGSLYTCGTHHKGLCGNLRDKTLKVTTKAGGLGCDELVAYRVGGQFKDQPKVGPSDYLAGVEVVEACSAHIHNTVRSADGCLFAFGCGSNGRMGLRKYLTGLHGKKARMKCYVMEPTLVEDLSGLYVASVAASRRHTAAVVFPKDSGLGSSSEVLNEPPSGN